MLLGSWDCCIDKPAAAWKLDVTIVVDIMPCIRHTICRHRRLPWKPRQNFVQMLPRKLPTLKSKVMRARPRDRNCRCVHMCTFVCTLVFFFSTFVDIYRYMFSCEYVYMTTCIIGSACVWVCVCVLALSLGEWVLNFRCEYSIVSFLCVCCHRKRKVSS